MTSSNVSAKGMQALAIKTVNKREGNLHRLKEEEEVEGDSKKEG
jgi:hypothetical protein